LLDFLTYVLMQLYLPKFSLVLLVGISSAGKTTFAQQHFAPTEILSSDAFRALVSNSESDQTATLDAFDALFFVLEKRLQRGLLTVIDATNLKREDRYRLYRLAKLYHCPCVAWVFNLPFALCEERWCHRQDRELPQEIHQQQYQLLLSSLSQLPQEKLADIHIFSSPEQLQAVQNIRRKPHPSDQTHQSGGFDIIGDVHGCFTELQNLLSQLGYQIEQIPYDEQEYGYRVQPPPHRRLVFVGDLVDRGPQSFEVLCLVMSMVKAKMAYCCVGNHDDKLYRFLKGKSGMGKGTEATIASLAKAPQGFQQKLLRFIQECSHHYLFDGGRLVVAHAGILESMQGRDSGAIRSFCLYGDTTGQQDEFGLPIRRDWAAEYRGKALVAYGHTPVAKAVLRHNTINLDTGCAFGGSLTALRYPALEIISSPALAVYTPAPKPFLTYEEDQDL
jgi:polynucleotide kinase-phosphatase